MPQLLLIARIMLKLFLTLTLVLFSCQGLPRMDLLSKSDPFVVVYIKDIGTTAVHHSAQSIASKWKEQVRTSTIWNNESPEWPDQIIMDYRFETVQQLRFEVFDRDTTGETAHDLSKQDYIGSFETTMSQLMGSRGATVRGNLVNERRSLKTRVQKLGAITIKGAEFSQNLDVVHFQLEGLNLDKKKLFGFGKSDPFYVISQAKRGSNGEMTYTRVFSSEVVKRSLSLAWERQVIPLQRLSNGEANRPLRFEVFSWNSSGSHHLIGSFTTTVEEMGMKTRYELENSRMRAKKGAKYVNSVSLSSILHLASAYSLQGLGRSSL